MAETEPEAMDAARKAVDADRLLPGEDPESMVTDDVRHWIAVYSELLAAKQRILGATLDAMQNADQEAARQELTTDRTVLSAEVERFQRRLAFWSDRDTRNARSD
jgi:hypothetical protein